MCYRPTVVIFPVRTDGLHDFRVWNSLLISYAGYKQADGTVIGDPGNLHFTQVGIFKTTDTKPNVSILGKPTFFDIFYIIFHFLKICQKLGWKSKKTSHDVLPLVLSANGQKPEWFEIPKELAMEVQITHPK